MIAPAMFTPVELPEKERIAGTVMTHAQLQVLHNRKLTVAQEILSGTYKGVEKDYEYGLILAYKQGELDCINAIIREAEEANQSVGMTGQQQMSLDNDTEFDVNNFNLG